MEFIIILDIIFAFIFSYFAYLNLNDNDAWLWVTIYLIAAGLCLIRAFGYVFSKLYLIVIFLYLVYAITIFFSKDGAWDWITKYNMPNIAASMQATKPWIENTREFFGLLILSGAMLLNYFIYN